MDAGLSREDVGDVIWASDGVQVLIREEKAETVNNLDAVGRIKVEVEEVELEQLQVAYSAAKDIKGTVASLRLDSIMSLGFGMSRSRAANLVKSGSVLVNYRREGSPSYKVKSGDTITISSQGNSLEVVELQGESRKGRQRVELKKIIK